MPVGLGNKARPGAAKAAANPSVPSRKRKRSTCCSSVQKISAPTPEPSTTLNAPSADTLRAPTNNHISYRVLEEKGEIRIRRFDAKGREGKQILRPSNYRPDRSILDEEQRELLDWVIETYGSKSTAETTRNPPTGNQLPTADRLQLRRRAEKPTTCAYRETRQNKRDTF